MENLIREDKSKLLIDYQQANEEKIAVVISGYGYSINHPILYYARAIAHQQGYSTLGIDFDYTHNDSFLELGAMDQDAYFDADIERLEHMLRILPHPIRLFIGKSMGTTAINRFMASERIASNDSLVLITPGNEWDGIAKNLAHRHNRALVIGSYADPKYASTNLDAVHGLKNVTFLEFEKENHGLEIGDYENDLAVLLRTAKAIDSFIRNDFA